MSRRKMNPSTIDESIIEGMKTLKDLKKSLKKFEQLKKSLSHKSSLELGLTDKAIQITRHSTTNLLLIIRNTKGKLEQQMDIIEAQESTIVALNDIVDEIENMIK